MNRTHRHLLARLGFAASAVASGSVLLAGPVDATTSIVPTVVTFGLGGPDTPLPLTYTTANDANEIVVTADGFVVGAACPTPLLATVAAGAATIASDDGSPILATTNLGCTVSLGLGDGAPASVDVTISERDGFNAELAAASAVVTLEQVDVDVTVGALLVDGTVHPAAEPRSVGDELTLPVTFELAAARSTLVTVASGTTLSGCDPQIAAVLNCTMTRTLSIDDLAAGTAGMAPTLFVDGFPVAVPDADPAVPSERRVEVSATAVPASIRVGESTRIDVVITNLGSIDLTELALSGAGIDAATCTGGALDTLTLAHGESLECSATHLATTADVDAVTPVVVRATTPFGLDSDFVDHDPTSATDVDAATIVAPYSVTDADVVASLSLGDQVAFADDDTIDVLPMSLTVSSVGALSNASVSIPVEPFPGVTLSGCDAVVVDDCLVSVGDLGANLRFDTSLDVSIDGALLIGPIDGESIDGRLLADGGIDVSLVGATLHTAGLAVSAIDETVDASGETSSFSIVLTVPAGSPVDVTIRPSTVRSAVVTGCEFADGTALSVIEGTDGYALGVLNAESEVTCALHHAVINSDRVSASTPVDVDVAASSGSAQVVRSLHDALPTIALVIEPGTAPTPPAHGYAVPGTAQRPGSVTAEFTLLRYGSLEAPMTVSATPDVVSCASPSATAPTRVVCHVTHELAAPDLAGGSYRLAILAGLGDSAPLSAAITAPLPYSAVAVLVTELSNPGRIAGYRPGDRARFLVQITNRGSLPLTFETLAVNAPFVVGAASNPSTQAISGCVGGATIAAGTTLDCDVVVTIPAGFAGTSLHFDVATLQESVTSFAVPVAIDPMPAATPAPPIEPVTELPETGSSTQTLLVCAFGLAACGFLLRRMSHRTPAMARVRAHR